MDKLTNMQLIHDKQLVDVTTRASLLLELPLWEVCQKNEVEQLVRIFKWRNFMQAMAFANKVAELAEVHNHHPALLVEWGKTTVSWWTHSLGGLHNNDFVMAAKSDVLYAEIIK